MSPSRGTAAVYYHPDAFQIQRADLKGRHSAGSGFLGGMARHLDAPEVIGVAPTRPMAEQFVQQVREANPARAARWIPEDRLELLARVGNLSAPDPMLAPHAWRRRTIGQRSYSITGVTHTICSNSTIDGMATLLVAPLQSWDAVVCTSTVARQVIEGVFDRWSDYLGARMGATAATRPQLPVIPLGVEADRFDPPDAPALRAGLRAKLGLTDDDVVVLFFGRLSFHAKAHPMPMFLGLEEAARRSSRRIVLMMTGRFSNDGIAADFRQGMERWCPSVRTVFVDGADDADTHASWFAADLFTSLSDNIQETFGLTPIEAMAAGLPVVATDWNGYRDTVAGGETGILVPTTAPQPGVGDALIAPYAAGRLTYDRYIGAISQCTAVDVRACAEAYLRLAEDAELRRRMSAAGRRRVRERYDWRVVIGAYQALWGELDARRRSDAESAPVPADGPVDPLRADPFETFRCYPTYRLAGGSRLRLNTGDPDGALGDRLALGMNTFSMPLICTPEDCRAVLHHLRAAGDATVDAIAALDPARAEARRRACAWLLKFDLVAVHQPADGD